MSIALVIFGMTVFSMYNTKYYDLEEWLTVFIVAGIVSVILMVAGAFPYLRKRETQLQFYMQPASLLEKYVFEFLLRYVGFFILFPLLFLGVSELAYMFSAGIRAVRGLGMENVERVSFLFESLRADADFGHTAMYLYSAVVLGMAFLFSGACRFMKHSLLKTVGFVIGLGAIIVYHFYFMVERMEFRIFTINEPDMKHILLWLVPMFWCLIMAYGFFKMKEKEV